MVFGPTSLRRAIQNNDVRQVKKILEQSDDPADAINDDFAPNCWFSMCTPSIGNSFYYAVSLSRQEIIEEFILNGGDVYSTGYFGESCLHLSIRLCNFEMVKLLIRSGIDINVTDDYGRSIIISAASSPFNTSIMLDYLVKQCKCSELCHKADYQGRTPLHVAVIYGNTNALKYLLDLGVDISTKTNKGETIFDLAKICLNPEVKRMLKEMETEQPIEND